jgi:TNF receptor-associated protein 1
MAGRMAVSLPRLVAVRSGSCPRILSRTSLVHRIQLKTSVDMQNRLLLSSRAFSSEAATKSEPVEHEFQAETRMLLDIVAKSLYSEKEVFIRELISNASDAIEKFRYLSMTGEKLEQAERNPLITITTDKAFKTLTIQDNGIGMTQEELISNLGTIARSGSKTFMQSVKESQNVEAKDIIGQFGVGFYSAFMVANKIEVYSKSSHPGSVGFLWASDGSGKYTIQEVDNVDIGTKIVVHLKPEDMEFADESMVRDVIKKYSNFVGSDVNLNGTTTNSLKPVWLMDPKEVTPEMHDEFYRYVSNAFDKPRFKLHYRTEAPMDIRALLYIPESRPGMFETSKDAEVGVSLYCRKVLIKNKADNLLPKWLRFVKGVVDSEDIPLNLSRELLQDSSLIRKLRTVLTNRILRYLQERSRKEPKSFMEFYKDYSFFLKEGVVTSTEKMEKEEIGKLLRFECSSLPSGETISLPEYCDKMQAGQRDIFYLSAPSRHLAESSPYFESLRKRNLEVLFCYESYDELVLMQMQEFDKKKLTSVEKEMRQDSDEAVDTEGSLPVTEQSELSDWIKMTLGQKASKVRTTSKLEAHPCAVTVEEMAAARHFIKTQGQNFSEEQRYTILQPQFEINPAHALIKKISSLKDTNPKLAIALTEQLFGNAMVSAGLVEDPRSMLSNINNLIEMLLDIKEDKTVAPPTSTPSPTPTPSSSTPSSSEDVKKD